MRRLGRGSAALGICALVVAAVGCGAPVDQAVQSASTTVAVAEVQPLPTTTEPPARALGVLGPADRPATITVLAGGDVLVHTAVWESAWRDGGGERFDFAPMFEPVAPVIRDADLALCHLEVPLSRDDTDLSSYPRFNAPGALADGLAAAGYDGCSVASNHTLDRGAAGIDATLDHLDRVGLGHAGAARTAEEAAAATTYEVGGRRIAHLSYTYGFNGMPRPADEPWRANLIDPAAILDDAARARADGAHLVLLSLHWGDEYVHTPSQYQRDVAAAVAGSPDIDLVIGHHAHVVQPVEQVHGTWVIYGVGNQVSNMLQPERRDGALLQVTFHVEPDGSVEVGAIDAVPTHVALPGHRVVPAPPDSADRTMGHLRSSGVEIGVRDAQ